MAQVTVKKQDLWKAIKKHCRECIGEGSAKGCVSESCKLFPYRMGLDTPGIYSKTPPTRGVFRSKERTLEG